MKINTNKEIVDDNILIEADNNNQDAEKEYIKGKLEYEEMEPWMEELIDRALEQSAQDAGSNDAEHPNQPGEAPVKYLSDELDRLYRINASEMAANIDDYNDWVEEYNEAVNDLMDEDPSLSEEEAAKKVQDSPEFHTYKAKYSEPLNLLIYGEPGGGKTSIVKDWAEHRHIAICGFTGGTLTAKVLLGATAKGKAKRYNKKTKEVEDKDVAVVMGNTSLDRLDDPMLYKDEYNFSILFLDELNRADSFAQSALLDLIQSRSIADISYPGGRRFFPRMLFTVAACNPPRTAREKRGDSYLSQAMGTRFEWMYWNADPDQTRKFWVDKWDERIKAIQKRIDKYNSGNPETLKRFSGEAGKKKIASYENDIRELENKKFIMNTLVDSGEFQFDDSETVSQAADNNFQGTDSNAYQNSLTLNARTLSNAINSSKGVIGDVVSYGDRDGGKTTYTKDSFLDILKDNAGSSKNVDAVIDVLLAAKPLQDIRNGVFDGNLFNIASSTVRRLAKKSGVEL